MLKYNQSPLWLSTGERQIFAKDDPTTAYDDPITSHDDPTTPHDDRKGHHYYIRCLLARARKEGTGRAKRGLYRV